MTTILIIAFIAFAAYSRIWLARVAKHDRVLFPFCQLRRDIMRFLREHLPDEANALSKEEYDSVLRLLDVVSETIHNYNQHKTAMFDVRKALKFSKKYRHTLAQATPINLTENAEIQKFHHQFKGLLAKAFLAYTPLIRSEILLRFFVVRSQIGYLAGKAHAQNAKEMKSIAHKAREDERLYGEIANSVLAAT